MTHFLSSEEKPEGFKLEAILAVIRKDILIRCLKIADDPRPEAKHVLNNNMQILNLISQSIQIAEDSSQVLDKSFGPSQSINGGEPRIGRS